MPLYDVTHSPAKLVDPSDAEAYEVLQAIQKRSHPTTWARIIRTIDDALDDLSKQQNVKLVWTKMAALFGHSSVQPKKYVDHLWNNVNAAVQTEKLTNKGMGGLLRWRISLREDTWLAYRQDTGERDADDGTKITISTYWIDNSFIPPQIKPTGLDLMKLQKAWGANESKR